MKLTISNRYTLIYFLLFTIIFIWSSYNLLFWKRTNVIIRWDISTYYIYLPAKFIYNDITSFKFYDKICEQYHPSGPLKDNGLTSIGNKKIIKTTLGLSILYSPFFFMADIYAQHTDYLRDGYSVPYQYMLDKANIFYALLGIIFLTKILIRYFDPKTTLLTLIVIVLGTNYYYYIIHEGGMPHNYLFFIHSGIIYLTIKWLDNNKIIYAIILGLLIGLAILIRPSEIIICFIPLLWGIISFKSLKERIQLFSKKKHHVIIVLVMVILVISPQLYYWKYITGNWIYYSYGKEGFNYYHPEIINGLFSYKKGWLIYTPIMLFSILGILRLKKHVNGIAFLVVLFLIVNLYITFSWCSWWYGGGFGMRALIQSYALLSLPMASFIKTFIIRDDYTTILKKLTGIFFVILFVSFITLNLIQTWQYHRGIIHYDSMTKEKYWDVFGKIK